MKGSPTGYKGHKIITERNAKLLRIAQRPKCICCGRTLKPYYHHLKDDIGPGAPGICRHTRITYRRFDGEYGYDGKGLFCLVSHDRAYQKRKQLEAANHE